MLPNACIVSNKKQNNNNKPYKISEQSQFDVLMSGKDVQLSPRSLDESYTRVENAFISMW